MFLAQGAFGELAELLGVPSAAIEGGAVTALAIGMLFLIRFLFSMWKSQDKQDSANTLLTTTLANVVTTISNREERNSTLLSDMNTQSKQSTEAITNLNTTTSKMLRFFEDSQEREREQFKKLHVALVDEGFTPLNKKLESLNQSFIANRTTRVIIKDKQGVVIADMTATPGRVGDEDVLEVVYQELNGTIVRMKDCEE